MRISTLSSVRFHKYPFSLSLENELVHAFKVFVRNNEIKDERSDSNCKIHLFCSTNAIKSSERTESSMFFFSCTVYTVFSESMIRHAQSSCKIR